MRFDLRRDFGPSRLAALFMAERQGKAKLRASANLAGKRHFAAVSLYQMFHYRQSQTRALDSSRP